MNGREIEPPQLHRFHDTDNSLIFVIGFVLLCGVLVLSFWPTLFPPRGCGPSENSLTRAKLQNLKTALVNYYCDIGKYPYIGTAPNDLSINNANIYALGETVSSNVLVNATVKAPFDKLGCQIYEKRWKGPYMDSEPDDFMVDGWGTKIKYEYSQKKLWLHSAGEDLQFDQSNPEAIASDTYKGDDLILKVSVVKF